MIFGAICRFLSNFAAQMDIVVYYNSDTKIDVECAATIGVFDGVHLGHRMLLSELKNDAMKAGLKTMAITFDRHPRQLFDANYKPQLLTAQKDKEFMLSILGVSLDYVVVLPFTMEMAQLSAHDFMQQVLKDRLNVKLLRLGYDNRFGHGRTDGFDDYVRYGRERGIKVLQSKPLQLKGYSEPVSSSLIRRLVAEDGNVKDAMALLKRPFYLNGTVKPGEHIGSTLGFPTANLEPDDDGKLIPAPGVYAVWAILGYGFIKPAMMNIGTRPTFNGQKQTLEVNIFDFEGDLYGKRIVVQFVERLRDERRFESPEALVAQLEEDKKLTLEIINKNE